MLDAFVALAGGIARMLPEPGGERTLAVDRRLRELSGAALMLVFDRAAEGPDQTRCRALAKACLEILRKVPSAESLEAVRHALRSSDPEIARHAARIVASAPRPFADAVSPPERGGDPKTFRSAR